MSTAPPTTRDPDGGIPISKGRRQGADAAFRGTATGAGLIILVVLALVAGFLILRAIPAFTAPAEEIPGGAGIVSYIWPLLFGTILAAIIALVVATPISVGIAIFISHYAPRRLAQTLGYLVDLLAAVPSVVYGLWGIFVLANWMKPVYGWLAENLSFIPLFAGPASASGRTILTAGLVLAVMVLPIITAISRDIFLQTPRLQEEAALALGATRWEMIRYAVIPYGRSGVTSAAMLGLGRALGETMAVALVLSVSSVVTFNLISPTNPSTIAANIALNFPEAYGLRVNVLIASGLALFVITFAVNFVARLIVSRSGVKA